MTIQITTRTGLPVGSRRLPEREMIRKAMAAQGRVQDQTTKSQNVMMQNDAKKDPNVISRMHGTVGRSMISSMSQMGYRMQESPR
mmetsp:Transcript_22012/g.51233  ORF Transcript_22012/g.51233 Transcript_22012/m.51233 type:complete len:85 (+) Transcript_22012:242-496(+)